jgi:hypothetical protein
MFRITGIEQLMIILDLARPIPLDALWDVLTSTRGIPGFYTSNIIGSSDQVPQTFAPSGLGWLYLFGGLPAILSGAAFMGPFLVFSWKAIDRFIPQLAHAVRAFLVMYLIILVTEGAMGAVIMRTTIGVATFWLAERLLVTRATGARSLGYLTRMPASSG